MSSLHPECVRCNRKRVAGRDKCQKCLDDSRHGSARLVESPPPRGRAYRPGQFVTGIIVDDTLYRTRRIRYR